MSIRIVHLSDLHLGNDFIPRALFRLRGWRKKVSDEVTHGLGESIRALRPEYVVVSGDFVNKAKWHWFHFASDYLKRLFQNAGIDLRERVLVVPGNHDVSFAPKKHVRDDLRLSRYKAFLKELFNESDSDTRKQRFIKIDIDQRLLFLCLDTTLKSLAPKAEGEIGTSQLGWARRKLEGMRQQFGSSFEEYVKVAVMHHHPLGIAGQKVQSEQYMQLLDSEDILKLLEEYGFNVVLHGHKHVPRIDVRVRADSGTMTIIGAGSATIPYLEEQGGSGNNFNVIELLPNNNQGKITRLKASPSGVFEPETEKKFSLFRVPREGFSMRRFRKLVKVELDGTENITIEREQIRVDEGVTMRSLPIKVASFTPQSKIGDFQLMCSCGYFSWHVDEDDAYDGKFVFHNPLTEKSNPVDVLYRYTIHKGLAMSANELMQRGAKSIGRAVESTSVTIVGYSQRLELEVEFPHNFHPVRVELVATYLESAVDIAGKCKCALSHDKATNTWTLVASNPPRDHSISLEWDLP